MRFPVPLVIEIPDDQLKQLAEIADWPRGDGGKVRAKVAVDGVRAQVLAAVRREFRTLGVDAEITIGR